MSHSETKCPLKLQGLPTARLGKPCKRPLMAEDYDLGLIDGESDDDVDAAAAADPAAPPAEAAADEPEPAAAEPVAAAAADEPVDAPPAAAHELVAQEVKTSDDRGVLLGRKLPDGWLDLPIERRVLEHHPILKVCTARAPT